MPTTLKKSTSRKKINNNNLPTVNIYVGGEDDPPYHPCSLPVGPAPENPKRFALMLQIVHKFVGAEWKSKNYKITD